MKKYIPEILFILLIGFILYKVLFFIMNKGYSDDYPVSQPTQQASFTYTSDIDQYDELAIDYIQTSDRFKNDTNKISWRTTEDKWKDSNYHRYQIGYDGELRFWSQKVIYVNKQSKNVYELDVFEDSLILWKSN